MREQPLPQRADFLEVVARDLFRARRQLRDPPRRLRAQPHVHDLWLLDRRAYPADEQDVGLPGTFDSRYERLGDARRRHVVELAYVRDRVLARERFDRHGSCGCDQSVRAVAAARLAIVAGLRGRAGDGQGNASPGGAAGARTFSAARARAARYASRSRRCPPTKAHATVRAERAPTRTPITFTSSPRSGAELSRRLISAASNAPSKGVRGAKPTPIEVSFASRGAPARRCRSNSSTRSLDPGRTRQCTRT